MTTIVRRTIEEIKARHILEPNLDDVYVEGDFDKEILDNALSRNEIFRPVYSIDTIDLPAEVLFRHGLTGC